MGFLADLQESGIRTVKSMPSWFRISLSILAIFFALTNLFSLSDHVFKFKGWLLDGISFYRQHYVGFLMKAGDLFSIEIVREQIDLTTALILFLNPLLQADRISLHPKSNKEVNRYKLFQLIIFFILIFVAVRSYEGHFFYIFMYAALWFFKTLVWLFMYRKVESKNGKHIYRRKIIIALKPLLIISLFLSLAAINKGWFGTN